MHAMLCVRRRPKQANTKSLAWDLQTQISNLHRQFCVLKLNKSRRTSSMVPKKRLKATADPMKVTSSCRPILVISLGASSSDLDRANSNPSTNITCTAREHCHWPREVLPTIQPSLQHCQNVVSLIRADSRKLHARNHGRVHVSLSLSLSGEPSHESRNASTSKQNCARSTLPSTEEASRSAALDPSDRMYVSACAVSTTRSSWVLHRPTACGLHPRRPVFHKPRTPMIARPYPNASFSPLLQRVQPPLVSTHFRCNVLRAGIARPRHAWEPGDHI